MKYCSIVGNTLHRDTAFHSNEKYVSDDISTVIASRVRGVVVYPPFGRNTRIRLIRNSVRHLHSYLDYAHLQKNVSKLHQTPSKLSTAD